MPRSRAGENATLGRVHVALYAQREVAESLAAEHGVSLSDVLRAGLLIAQKFEETLKLTLKEVKRG
jgi:hypothetical protein